MMQLSKKKTFRVIRTISVCTVFVCTIACASTDRAVKILPLGDSITAGAKNEYCYRMYLYKMLANSGYTVDFVGTNNTTYDSADATDYDGDHEGWLGWTTERVLISRIKRDFDYFKELEPEIVLIHLGSNDALFGLSDSPQVVANRSIGHLADIIDLLRKANPRVIILLAQIIPVIRGRYEQNERIEAINQEMPALVSDKSTPRSPVILVNHWIGFNAETMLYDFAHLNEVGANKMAENWYNALVEVLPTPKSAPK